MNIYESMKNKITDKITEAFSAAVAAGDLPEEEECELFFGLAVLVTWL